MSAFEALRLAHENGVRLSVSGTQLTLDADLEPPAHVLEALRQNKAGIVQLLSEPDTNWTVEDWQVFFDERAGFAEFDGGLTRAAAEALAYQDCITEWLNCHLEQSNPDSCAWCKKAVYRRPRPRLSPML